MTEEKKKTPEEGAAEAAKLAAGKKMREDFLKKFRSAFVDGLNEDAEEHGYGKSEEPTEK